MLKNFLNNNLFIKVLQTNSKIPAGQFFHNRFLLTKCLSTSPEFRSQKENNKNNFKYFKTSIFLTVGLAGFYIFKKQKLDYKPIQCKEKKEKVKAGERRDDLPNFTYDQISDHTDDENGYWVVYKDGVYDITHFLKNHPGGPDKIKMAIGTSVEPFWDLYSVHLNDHVFEILESLRIGNVHPDEEKYEFESGNYYSEEPKRHKALKVNSAKPFNAESPLEWLTEHFYTPNDFFFVRNHLPVPKRKDLKNEIQVEGVGVKGTVVMTIEEMRSKFKEHEISSTVMCAGNRRSQMHQTKPVKGLQWGAGAISNAKWKGIYLSDLLKHLGVTIETGKHVIFQGGDKDIEGNPYEASIPMEIALDPNREVLLAYQMNGKVLPLDHGFPIRVVVPGVIGARQVKWLQRVLVSGEESGSFWQQKDYKTFNPSMDIENSDPSHALAIQEYPVQSAICMPSEEDEVSIHWKKFEVQGYALSGGGRKIIRVDVSVDGGKTWKEADLECELNQPFNRRWAWCLWQTEVEIPEGIKPGDEMEVICKATDSSHNSQPETDLGIWNARGLLCNRWPRVKVILR